MNTGPKPEKRRWPAGGISLGASSLAAVVSLMAIAVGPAAAIASAPPGPRLATVELIQTKGSEWEENASSPFVALTTFGASGQKARHLLKARLDEGKGLRPFPFFGPAWTGDGRAIAFLGSKGKSTSVYAIGADGEQLQRLGGVTGPVFSSDGKAMAFSTSHSHHRHPGQPESRDYSSTATWVADLGTGKARRLTAWRNGLSNVPTSFSPDGSVLALTRDDDNVDGQQVVLAHVDGSGSTTLFPHASEAVISPDGTQIAFAGYLNPTVIEAEENRDYEIGELYVANIDGTGVKRLTKNDDGIETSPSWDPSSERLAYVQMKASTSFDPALDFLFPFGNEVREMNADGSCKKTVRRSPELAFYGVMWEPGEGRAAGRIACR
ncbi:MAG: TolB family protein [Solirubrobacterales bacterium]